MMLATSFVAAGAILLSWHEGSQHRNGSIAGVHVIAAPPTQQAPSSTAAQPARPTRKARAKVRATATTTRRSLDGAVVSTPYGNVQVRVILVGRRLVDVQPLHLTDANDRSRAISAGAEPTLRQEALAAQSAKIDAVSGATYTSEGYRQSLQAVLDQAHL